MEMDSNIVKAATKAILESEHRRQQNRHDQNLTANEIVNKMSLKIKDLDAKADQILQELREFRINPQL